MAVAVITRLGRMVRWEPGARERLQAAALELFATRGFEQTTAAEIAQAVGLTERTFFRNFSDKREVLFHGQEQFLRAFLDGVDKAPADASALELIAAALQAGAEAGGARRYPAAPGARSAQARGPGRERRRRAADAGHRRAGRHPGRPV